MENRTGNWKIERWQHIFSDARRQMNRNDKGVRVYCPQCRSFYGDYPSDSDEFMRSWTLMKATYTRKERTKWTKIGYYCDKCKMFIPLE